MDIRGLGPEDWRVARDLRLRALAQAPWAFGSTLAGAEEKGPADWQDWVTRGGTGATFVASWNAEACGLIRVGPEGADAGLTSLWVAEAARRHGLAQALVQATLRWARGQGYGRVVLDVRRQNSAAIALYRRMGFGRVSGDGETEAGEERYGLTL